MAHDFAAKPRPRKRAPSPKKAPPKPVKKKPSLLLWLVAASALGGLGYLLVQLAGVQPDPVAAKVGKPQAADKQPAQSQTNDKAKQPPKPLPEVAAKYDFYELLPKSKVEPPKVDAYQSTPKSEQNHQNVLLQAGSFRSEQDAERMRAQLLLLGLPNVTSTKVTSSNGSTWYRVRVGPFSSRSKLNKAYDKLVQQNIQPLRIKLS